MNQFVKVLMNRDGYSKEDAIKEWKEIRQRVASGEDPEEILFDEYGLEPDYVMDIL